MNVPFADIPAAPVVALMGVGVIVALAGHATRSRPVLATGLTILFLATAGMIAAAFVAYHGSERDPRPCTIAGC